MNHTARRPRRDTGKGRAARREHGGTHRRAATRSLERSRPPPNPKFPGRAASFEPARPRQSSVPSSVRHVVTRDDSCCALPLPRAVRRSIARASDHLGLVSGGGGGEEPPRGIVQATLRGSGCPLGAVTCIVGVFDHRLVPAGMLDLLSRAFQFPAGLLLLAFRCLPGRRTVSTLRRNISTRPPAGVGSREPRASLSAPQAPKQAAVRRARPTRGTPRARRRRR